MVFVNIIGYCIALPTLISHENDLEEIILCGLDLLTVCVPP